MRKLAGIIDDQRWRGLIGLGLIGLVQSLSLLFFIVQIRNRIMTQQGQLIQVLLLLAPLVLVLAYGRYLERTVAERVAQSYIHQVRNQVFGHFLRLPTKDALRIGRGSLLMRLTGDLLALRNWLVLGVAPVMVLSIWLAVALITLWVIDPLLVAVLTVLSVLALPVYWLGGRYLYRASSNTRKHRSRLMNYVNQRIASVALIQSMNQTGREERNFHRLSNEMLRWQLKRARGGGLLRASTEFISLILLGLLILVGHYRVLANQLSADQFVLVIVVALYLLPQLRRLGRIYEYWTQYQLARSKLERFLRRATVAAGGKRLKLPTGAPVSVALCVTSGRAAKLELDAPAGARVILSGASGSGKSRLLRALAGIEPMSDLRCMIEAIQLEDLATNERQRRIVLVNEPSLWQTTIRANLTYGMRRGGPEDIDKAISLCGLRALVEGLPKGLDSQLGSRGVNLSSVEELRLMLARALLRRPSLLLIDHPALSNHVEVDELLSGLSDYFPGTIIVTRITDNYPSWATTCWVLPQPIFDSQSETSVGHRTQRHEVNYGQG
ncbi:ABC-type multidrug transport system fused ATPase/permease subunit [Pseudomonas sp. SJZ079]|uniref:ABC transporter transmembrane domain-containing protein n=1 Tax=Pseudomonas sp. SJZ079 TaxID=2572887 RepID=UPI001199BA80|nr:ABC transporter ATP-binding protein [Pseudomonas sp. SJZ079]TWC28579.1 ABC-type multidrug transport system fused ATPase/permease subunit [Pseudomonas sp. SJZ079]